MYRRGNLVLSPKRVFSKTENSNPSKINAIVARTLATWHASDGSVFVQIANPSPDGVSLLPQLCLGRLYAVSVVARDKLHVNAVANNPVSDEEVRRARSDLEGPLSKAFSDSRFTTEQKEAVIDLCAKYSPVLSLSKSKLGRCTIAEATSPVPRGTRPVDRPPYRPNPRTSAVIDK